MQVKNGIIKHVHVSVKIITRAKKDCGWNPSRFICENGKYLKSIVHEIINIRMMYQQMLQVLCQ